ncbi:membrane lipoprotein lipid attachment site-containing protein [Bacillus chungangensis]|uniref:Lipoprotein n=1 Tax=Bacillus chungangensis TaxID=587633 RepID=A0ABT9WWS6_9BACI|nr:membrane lipoprotein lipid attachment site-containing protein [Bacillus chungangensis]MDQ0177689.1 hypothetical protein [Bacillus chungangensis]
MKKMLCLLFIVFLLSGCKQDFPKPEASVPNVQAADQNNSDDMIVRHFVQGKDILVECFVPGISFSGNKQKQGKMIVYLNGNLYAEYETAAFIIKNLEKGTHHVKIDIVSPENQQYGISKEFSVIIPSS